jgi:GTP-binding protein
MAKPTRVQFVKSAVGPEDFPPRDLPDIAVAGRSNVGKSSLINNLFQRTRSPLAHVSSTPGKTRLVNFFRVEDAFYLVDLPGFGYAKRSRDERERWRNMVSDYVDNRPSLLAMLLLIDIRRGPEEEESMLLEALAEFGIQAIVVLTKCDKLAKSKRRLEQEKLARALGGRARALVGHSSRTSEGREALWREMERCLASRSAS